MTKFTEINQIIEQLKSCFSPDAADGLDAVIQYHVSGKDSGTYKIIIKDGTLSIEEGIHDSPTTTISLADETWLGLFNHSINPMLAFTKGKIKVKGDFGLAMKVPKIFPEP